MSASDHGTKYRPEIDGLRAIAVIIVIFFHAGFRAFRGGFVGVDVFFVISGYLITRIIVADVRAGRFTIAGFYERRARRILPALFVVLLATFAAGMAWMAPAQLKGLGTSIVAVVFFLSNFYFARATGYFQGGAAEFPLLHTWSLGVEEQYYVLFPLFIAAVWRRGLGALIWATVAIAAASFAFGEWQAYAAPTPAFFLAPSRVWELLLGALVTVASLDAPLHGRVSLRTRQSLAAIGMALILAAVALYSEGTPFPGIHALLPTIGAALIIGFAARDTVVGRLLAHRLMVAIGLVSYSAYLWHQPLFAFAHILTVGQVTAMQLGILTAVSFALAYITWRWVETPFRDRRRFTRQSIFAMGAAVSLAFVALGAWRYLADRDNRLSFAKRVNYGLSAACEFGDRFTPPVACATSPAPRVLLWGDSFAMHIAAGLTASDSGIALVQATKSLCGPFDGAAPLSLLDRQTGVRSAEECLRFSRSVVEYARAQPTLQTVVMASPFLQYVDSARYELLTGGGRVAASVRDAAPILERTIRELRDAGKRVVLVAPPPGGDFNMGDCVERERLGLPLLGARRGCRIMRAEYLRRYGPALALLARVEREAGVGVIRFDSLLCDAAACRTSLHGVAVYRDGSHFSYAGSEMVGRAIGFSQRVERMAR